MRPRHIPKRNKIARRPSAHVGYSKELAITALFCLVLIVGTLFAVFLYQNIQSEIVQFRKAYEMREREIVQLKNDINRMNVENAKRQSVEHITRKIREFGLALRPTEPSQIRVIERPRSVTGDYNNLSSYTAEVPAYSDYR